VWEIGTVEFFLYVTLAASLIAPLTSPSGKRDNVAPLVMAGIGVGSFAVAAGLSLYASSLGSPLSFYSGLVVQDSFTSLMLLGAAVASALFLLAVGTDGLQWTSSPALYSLVPMALFGAFFLAGATNALVILASWLLVSIISYIIIASPDAREAKAAGIRYIYVGMVATLMLVSSLTFLALASSTYSFSIVPLADVNSAARGLMALAVLFLLAALGFKVGIFPFHWWLPSVYGRGDGRTVSFVAAVAKLAFLAVLTRTFIIIASDGGLYKEVALTLAVLAVATMTYGNVAAFTTRDLQVILAYSSMAQVGYIFAAMAAASYFAGVGNEYMLKLALFAVALQSIAYAMAKAPLFAFVGEVGRGLDSLKGLMRSSPLSAVTASVLLYSLLGVPPLLGFWGKLYMFFSAAGIAGYGIWLVLAALINSGISSVYYITASRELLRKDYEGTPMPRVRYSTALTIGALLLLVLGIVAPLLLGSIVSIYL
jgi:NADH-quinone oxidoreductase subunit N